MRYELGVALLLLCAVLSATSGLYTERALKGTDAHFLAQQVALAGCSILVNLVVQGPSLREGPIVENFLGRSVTLMSSLLAERFTQEGVYEAFTAWKEKQENLPSRGCCYLRLKGSMSNFSLSFQPNEQTL